MGLSCSFSRAPGRCPEGKQTEKANGHGIATDYLHPRSRATPGDEFTHASQRNVRWRFRDSAALYDEILESEEEARSDQLDGPPVA
jgi:hypothetical protein